MPIAVLSQEPIPVELRWRAGDPVSLSIVVNTVDWSGVHTAMVGDITFPVTAVLAAGNTTFTFTLSQAASAPVGVGGHSFWCRNAAGLTRFAGKALVSR